MLFLKVLSHGSVCIDILVHHVTLIVDAIEELLPHYTTDIQGALCSLVSLMQCLFYWDDIASPSVHPMRETVGQDSAKTVSRMTD